MLDQTDKRILFELDKDSRISLTTLSKKLRKSKEVTHYRIKKLEQSGIIASYEMLMNFPSFNMMSFAVYFRPKKVTPERESKLLQYLLEHPNIIRVSQSIGEFDLSIALGTSDLYILDQKINEIKNKFSEELGDFEINARVKIIRFIRSYLINQKRNVQDRMTIADYTLPKVKVDELDRRILQSLSQNARKSCLEISKEVGASNSTIISRLKRLLKDKVIKSCTIFLNNNKMGYECYRLLIKMNELSEEKENKIISYCEGNPNITHYIRGVGAWNLEIIIEVENLHQYHAIYEEIRTLFSQNIQKMTSLTMINNLSESTTSAFNN